MLSFLPYVLKCLWRHRTRSLLTVAGAAVAMFVFCIVGSVQEGLDRLVSDEQSQRTLIVFQENRFCPATSKLPLDYAAQVRKIPGVQDVMPIQVWTNNCRASLDIVVFNGVPGKQLKDRSQLVLDEGDWSEFSQRRDAALVGRNVARRRGLIVGTPFSIGEMTVHVAGIFSSPVAAEENLIYTNLDFLQLAAGRESAGVVTQHEVTLASDADPQEVANAIDAALKSGPVATTTRSKGAFQVSTLSDLVDMISFAHWLGYACVGLVLSLVATTTVMAVQDRVKEHAVLQTLGLRPARVLRLVILESTLLCGLGGTLGTTVALLLLTFGGLAIGAEGVAIGFQPSLRLAAAGLVVSIAVGVTAGMIPAFQAARANIVQALRAA
jgi:putative ABC transport system permease protein